MGKTNNNNKNHEKHTLPLSFCHEGITMQESRTRFVFPWLLFQKFPFSPSLPLFHIRSILTLLPLYRAPFLSFLASYFYFFPILDSLFPYSDNLLTAIFFCFPFLTLRKKAKE